MKTIELTCIQCPLGCPLTVTMDGDTILKVEGNTCKRGEIYAQKEITAPSRTVTSTVAVEGGVHPVVAVRTNTDIPKDKIFDCMKEINAVLVKAPVKIGDVIIENVCGTGVNIVAAANMGVK